MTVSCSPPLIFFNCIWACLLVWHMSTALISVSFGSHSIHACMPEYFVPITNLSWIKSSLSLPKSGVRELFLFGHILVWCLTLALLAVIKQTFHRSHSWSVQNSSRIFIRSSWSVVGICRWLWSWWHSFPITNSSVARWIFLSLLSNQVASCGFPIVHKRTSSFWMHRPSCPWAPGLDCDMPSLSLLLAGLRSSAISRPRIAKPVKFASLFACSVNVGVCCWFDF